MKFTAFILGVILFSAFTIAQEMKQAPASKGHDVALKELDKFHEALHPLVHEALEKGDFDTIRNGLDNLLTKAMDIKKAKLSKKFSSKKKQFQKNAKQLVSQLTYLTKNKKTLSNDTLKSKFEEMHETYESLANLLVK